ncbi:MAG: hypothetical protein EG824_09345 [Deltaproteobacteria bacterium]|nr:hypothetical protein [Deltaproteobacteria bacterium]
MKNIGKPCAGKLHARFDAGAGYLLGIPAGLGLQHLGWLSGIVNRMAWLAIVGMFVVDLVLLAG